MKDLMMKKMMKIMKMILKIYNFAQKLILDIQTNEKTSISAVGFFYKFNNVCTKK